MMRCVAPPITGALRTFDESRVHANDVRRAEVLNNLGDLQHSAGEHAQAHAFYRQALDVHERAHGKDDQSAVGIVNNIAVLLMDTRRHEEALPLLRRALKLTRAKVRRVHTWFRSRGLRTP